MERDELFISGINITPAKAFADRRAGHLRRVAAGVYVNAGLSEQRINEVILSNACRIAFHLHPKAALAGRSAYYHAQVNGTIHLASENWYADKQIGPLKISFIRMNAEYGLPASRIMISDDLGKFNMHCLKDEACIVMAMSRNRKDELLLGSDELTGMARRGIDLAGSAFKFKAAIRGMRHSIRASAQAIDKSMKWVDVADVDPEVKAYVSTFTVSMNRIVIGNLYNDGVTWGFRPGPDMPRGLFSSRGVIDRTSVPVFFASLLYERGLKGDTADISTIVHSTRYLSGIAIYREDEQPRPDRDILLCDLEEFSGYDRIWTGKPIDFIEYDGAGGSNIERLAVSQNMPRIGGRQQKLPVSISKDGLVLPAEKTTFSHILKMPGRKSMEGICVNEWYCLQVAKAAGIETAASCLVPLEGSPPAILIQRFDIPDVYGSNAAIMLEEFSAILGYDGFGRSKFRGDMMDVAERMMRLTTQPERDREQLMRRVICGWALGDTDMHLRNIGMLKHFSHGELLSMRMAPAYDIISSSAIDGMQSEMALPIAGEYNYTMGIIRTMGVSIGLTEGAVDAIAKDVAMRISEFMARFSCPDFIRNAGFDSTIEAIHSKTTARMRQVFAPRKERKSHAKTR